MTNVQVTCKELSNGLQAVLITVDGVEGMTFPEVVRVLGIPQQTITTYCGKTKTQFHRISGGIAKALRKDNVIPMRGAPPSFVPKSVVQELVRFYSTPETDVIYKQLWSVVEDVYNGNFVQAATTVGHQPKEIREILRLALDELDRVSALNEHLTIVNTDLTEFKDTATANPIATALRSVIFAKDIEKQYPACRIPATEFCRSKNVNLDKFDVPGRITVWLRDCHGFHKDTQFKKSTPRGPAFGYDPAEVNAIMVRLNLITEEVK